MARDLGVNNNNAAKLIEILNKITEKSKKTKDKVK